jgi:hypothetical protein
MVAIGTNTVTAIARRFILPTIADNIYSSNVLLYRILQTKKRMVQGGYQIEVPLLYSRFTGGGPYRGAEPFSVNQQDTIKNAVFEWKQHQVTWAVDGLTLIKVDSPEAIANYLRLQGQQAFMEMAENLATGLFGSGTTSVAGYSSPYNEIRDIDGALGLFGVGTTIGNNTYGGITRTSNTWWNASLTGTTSTSTLSMAALQSAFGTATVGGQHPTLILSRQDQYNRYWALNMPSSGNPSVTYPREPGGHDELLASAGFTNLYFNNVPWVVDSHVGDGIVASNSAIQMWNENMIGLAVSPRADFVIEPFQRPVGQDAMITSILWAGNLFCMNARTQGGIFNVNA